MTALRILADAFGEAITIPLLFGFAYLAGTVAQAVAKRHAMRPTSERQVRRMLAEIERSAR